MKIKDTLRLFVPPIYYKVKHRIQILREQPIHSLPKVEHKGCRMVIIGNGPSLNKTIELYEKQIQQADSIMVNFSARTTLYEQIRPNYYIMADPGFLVNETVAESVELLINDIVAKTNWPLVIFMPDTFEKWWACGRLLENQNIKVLFFNTHMRKKLNLRDKFYAWDKNLISPPTQTIIATCIWLSLYLDYKETYLVGVDTSFLQDIYVGQNDNVLYTIDSHYYKNSEVCPEEVDPEKKGHKFGMNMEQLLQAVHLMFQDYYQLLRYSAWKGLKIFNASEFSMIDCFERRRLDV